MPRTGRPRLGTSAKAVPMSIRLTARQYALLKMIAAKITANTREGFAYSPEVSPVEAIRMIILMTAEEMDLTTLLEEPAETFDLKPKKKPDIRPKKKTRKS